MQQKVKFRLSQPGVAERLQAVVQAGRKDFNEIYRSVWDMVTHDTDGVDRYKAAVAGAIAAAAPHSEERQEAQSVAELLQHAGQCKVASRKLSMALLLNVKVTTQMLQWRFHKHVSLLV